MCLYFCWVKTEHLTTPAPATPPGSPPAARAAGLRGTPQPRRRAHLDQCSDDENDPDTANYLTCDGGILHRAAGVRAAVFAERAEAARFGLKRGMVMRALGAAASVMIARHQLGGRAAGGRVAQPS